jgi:hypothetical protein
VSRRAKIGLSPVRRSVQNEYRAEPGVNWGRFYLTQQRAWKATESSTILSSFVVAEWSFFDLSSPAGCVEREGVVSGESRRRRVIEALDELLAECRSPNWDGYGAEAVPKALYQGARQFCESLPPSIPDPEVGADPDGEISFDWFKGERDLFSVSVGLGGRLSYAGRFGESRVHGTEYFRNRLPETIVQSIHRLFS